MVNNVNNFIASCKLLLHDGVTEHNIINGELTKCSNFENENISIIKSLDDYSMIIIKKDIKKAVISLDKEGHISQIDGEWSVLAEQIKA